MSKKKRLPVANRQFKPRIEPLEDRTLLTGSAVTPTIVWPVPNNLMYGTPLSNSQLDATATAVVSGSTILVSGTFSYNHAVGTLLPVGQDQALTVNFTPLDTVDYTSATGSTTINVENGWDGLLGDQMHSGVSSVASQPLDAIHWSTKVDYNPSDADGAHYGAPVISPNNTVIVPFRSAADQFTVEAFNGATGTEIWSYTSDYTLPPYGWLPPYGVALSSNGVLYFPGAGGTVYGINNPDTPGTKTPFQTAFYGSLAYYKANQAGFAASIQINTPITADSNGNIYFGYEVNGSSLPTGVTGSGIARIDANGHGTFVAVSTAAADSNITIAAMGSAPALSADGSTLYVAVTGQSNSYLLGLNSTTLAAKYKTPLQDPRDNSNSSITTYSTSAPMVAPDGTVFFGLLPSGNYNGSRGFMLHFSADLSTEFTPGAFGWDDTPSVIPASMVPSYHGTSTYLILTKYNNYFAGETGPSGGNGINKIAILDPYATMPDPRNDGDPGLQVMNEVLTVNGPTPDQDAINDGYPNGVREWCVNATAVDPFTDSVLLNSEDGNFYRWNLASDTLTGAVTENPGGVGEPYTSTAIGPDGTIYGLNGGYLFAMGGLANYTLSTVSSASPVAPGQAITFTTTLASTSGGATPTGIISYYDGSMAPANLLNAVPLVNGEASFTTSALATGTNFIITSYSGGGGYAAGSTMLPESVLNGTMMSIVSSANTATAGQPITFTATVSGSDSTPATSVIFKEGNTVLANVELVDGVATYTTSSLSVGQPFISAVYRGEDGPTTTHTPAVVSMTENIQGGTSTTLTSSANPSVFGTPVTFTATVSSTNQGIGVPAGTVTFSEGNTILAANVPVNSSGTATLTTSTLSAGNYAITAMFTGNVMWANSSGDDSSSPQVVDQAVTIITWPSPALLTYGTTLSALQLDASANAVVNGANVPVAGTFAYNHAVGNLLPVGNNQSLTVSFAPADSTDFTSASASRSISVVEGWDGLLADEQHSGNSPAAAQALEAIHWQTTVDQTGQASSSHYGSPVITGANTVIVPVRTSAGQMQLQAFNGFSGAVLWTTAPFAYTLNYSGWVPPYEPVLASSNGVLRVYFAGTDGQVYYINNPDNPVVNSSHIAAISGNEVFYSGALNSAVQIDTPLTADVAGAVYFGFLLTGTTSQLASGGLARLDPKGHGSFITAAAAAGVSATLSSDNVAIGSAPALSPDGSIVYASVNTSAGPYLVGVNASAMTAKGTTGALYHTALTEGIPNFSYSTSSPTVGPDGTVFFGVLGTGSRGLLLHFSADLGTQFSPGAFGWDDTPSIVPASMVPSYQGTSSYLILTSYDNYAGNGGGNGVNQIAILDPYATEADPRLSEGDAQSLVMNEVLTITAPTPDGDLRRASFPGAVTAWSSNAMAVDPANDSVYVTNADGRVYRWDLQSNTLDQSLALTIAASAPYTPTAIGPDGTVYAIDAGTLYAMGGFSNYSLSNTSSGSSSAPGQPVTFTTKVTSTSGGSTPTGSITYWDTTYPSADAAGGFNETPVTISLATVPLVNGLATYTTSALAGIDPSTPHFIRAAYSGDARYVAGSTTLVQTVVNGTAPALTSSTLVAPAGQSVTFTATVPGNATGHVWFGDGSTLLASATLQSGQASFTTSSLISGFHQISAEYQGDTTHNPGVATLTESIVAGTTSTGVASSPNPVLYGNAATFTATVRNAGTGGGIPSGAVTFSEGATTLAANVPVDGSGHASFSTTTLSLGNHTITASFTGTGGWLNSSGSSSAETVQEDTKTAVSSSLNPLPPGGSVTFLATITPTVAGPGVPTGTETFKEGTTILAANVKVDANGHASFSTSSLKGGSNVVTASFTGTNFWVNSTGSFEEIALFATTTAPVSPAPTNTNPSTYGKALTFLAKVTSTSGGGGTPTGSVTFFNGTIPLGTRALVAGTASITLTTLPGGNDSLFATYLGAGFFQGSSSQTPFIETINKMATQTSNVSAASTNPANPTYRQPLTFSATVTNSSGIGGVPTGAVTFMNGTTSLGTRTLVSGTAAITLTTLPVGNDMITAQYLGTAAFQSSSSPSSLSQTVSKIATTTSVVASNANPSTLSQAVTLTASVSNATSAGGLPTGSITFENGTTVLGTRSLVSGSASITISNLPAGTDLITAHYVASGNFLGSSSPSALSQVVNSSAPGAITLPSNNIVPQSDNQDAAAGAGLGGESGIG